MSDSRRPGQVLLCVASPHVEAALRLLGGLDIQVASDMSGLWIRLNGREPAQLDLARRLPARMYHLVDHRQAEDEAEDIKAGGRRLVLLGQSVACRTLPKLHWLHVTEIYELRLPTPSLAASPAGLEPISISLAPAHQEIPAVAGLFDLDELAAWVETAPDIRLQRLRYATYDSMAFVAGSPLPPIQSYQFLGRYENIYVPLGKIWTPRVDAAMVAKIFGLAEEDLLIWQADHVWSVLPSHYLMTLRRSSLRQLRLAR
jgi:hypothetical protein